MLPRITPSPKATMVTMNPTKRLSPSLLPSPELYTSGTTNPLIVLPTFEIVNAIPRAKESSLPLNHLEIITDYAAHNVSPPALKKLTLI